jgi:ketosteroid isomerase-like protein
MDSGRWTCRSSLIDPTATALDESGSPCEADLWRDTGQAMSQENVDRARDFFAAYNARDDKGCDRLLAVGAEVVTVSQSAGISPVTWARGDTNRYFEGLDEAWADLRIEIDDYRDLGDRVLALGRVRGTGKASRAPVEGPFAALFVVRDGLFARVDSYGDRAKALEAAGLSE